MPSPKEMLKKLLTVGKLTAQEKEAFENMWDQTHRTSRLSNKQLAWIEKSFFKQGLDRGELPAKENPSPKVGFMYDVEAKRTVTATNMKTFEAICPKVAKDSPLYKKVKNFFQNGGERFELRAGLKPPK